MLSIEPINTPFSNIGLLVYDLEVCMVSVVSSSGIIALYQDAWKQALTLRD